MVGFVTGWVLAYLTTGSIGGVAPPWPAEGQEDPPRVLLVGAVHTYPEGQRLAPVLDEIEAFAPEAILVETPPPDDAFGLQQGWGYSELVPLLVDLLARHPMRTRTAGDTARVLLERLEGGEEGAGLRARLLHALLLDADVANALLQSHRLFGGTEPTGAERKRVEPWLPVDRLMDYRIIGEERDDFGSLIFPLADRLGVERLLPFDSRDDVPAYEEAWAANDREIAALLATREGVAADGPEAEALRARALGYERRDSLRTAAAARGGLVQLVNAPWYRKLEAEVYARRIALAPESGEAMLAAWERRNAAMAANALQAMEALGVDRAVAVVGSAHLTLLAQELERRGAVVEWLTEGVPPSPW